MFLSRPVVRAVWPTCPQPGQWALRRVARVGALEAPIVWRGDVLVVGGDLSGVAASVEAAKHGAKTAIVCEEGFLGGLATGGFLCHLGRMAEEGKAFGFVADLLYRLDKLGGRRGGTADPEALKVALDDMLLSVGVEPFFHTKPVGALVEHSWARGALAVTKRGYVGLYAKRVVDATPDGRVEMALRGGPFRRGRRKVLVCSAGLVEGAKVGRAEFVACPEPLDLLGRGVWLRPGPSEGEAILVARRAVGLDPADPVALSIEAARGRWAVRRALELLRRALQELAEAYVAETSLKPWLVDPADAVSRPRRRPLRSWEALEGRTGRDAVLPLFADLLRADLAGNRLDLLPSRGPFGLPYGWLLPKGIEGLLCAPPLWVLSSTPLVWLEDLSATALAGQVAGLAAAISIEKGVLPSKLSPSALRKPLEMRGLPVR